MLMTITIMQGMPLCTGVKWSIFLKTILKPTKNTTRQICCSVICGGFTQTSTAVDQTLEQTLNKETKRKGGIIGFILNKGTVQGWVLTAHERSAMCCNWKKIIKFQESPETVHKEATRRRIDGVERDVGKIIYVIEGWRNPFEGPDDLVCLSSGSVATKEVSDALLDALETGTTVAEEFIKKRIIDKSVDFYDSLSKNNLNTFKSMAAATKVKVNAGNFQNWPKFVCQISCDWPDTVNGYAWGA